MSFLDNLQSVYAHVDKSPYAATFKHTIPGPARGVRADCLWWPPVIPSAEHAVTVAESSRARDRASRKTRRRAGESSSEFDAGPSRLPEDDEDEDYVGVDRDDSWSVTEDDDEFGDGGFGAYQEPRVSVMLFIPGNPGIVTFYQSFLDTIHTAHPSLGILAHSHLGHSPRLSLNTSRTGGFGDISINAAKLEVQVESAIEAYDALVNEYRDVGGCKIVLVGHSIGAWVVTQVMKARPDAVDGAFLLFPTLSNMARTPNYNKLWPQFLPPSAYILASLSYLFFSLLLPAPLILSLVNVLFKHWPRHQQYVLRSLLRSPRAVFSALRMGRDEMNLVKGLGESVDYGKSSSRRQSESGSVAEILRDEARRVWIFYGDGDNWVLDSDAKRVFGILREGGGALSREEVEVEKMDNRISRFRDSNANSGSDSNPDYGSRAGRKKWTAGVCGEVVFGTGVSHDFCINHDAIIGQLCAKWLSDGALVQG